MLPLTKEILKNINTFGVEFTFINPQVLWRHLVPTEHDFRIELVSRGFSYDEAEKISQPFYSTFHWENPTAVFAQLNTEWEAYARKNYFTFGRDWAPNVATREKCFKPDPAVFELPSPVFGNLHSFYSYASHLFKFAKQKNLLTHDPFAISEGGHGQINVVPLFAKEEEENYITNIQNLRNQISSLVALFPALSFAVSEPCAHMDICPSKFAVVKSRFDADERDILGLEFRAFDMLYSAEEFCKAIIFVDRLIDLAKTLEQNKEPSTCLEAWQAGIPKNLTFAKQNFRSLLFLLGLKPSDYDFFFSRLEDWYNLYEFQIHSYRTDLSWENYGYIALAE